MISSRPRLARVSLVVLCTLAAPALTERAAAQHLPIPDAATPSDVERQLHRQQVRTELNEAIARIQSEIGQVPGAVLSMYASDAVYRGPSGTLRGETALAERFEERVPGLFGFAVSILDVTADVGLATTLLSVVDPSTGATATDLVVWQRRRSGWTIVHHEANAPEVDAHPPPAGTWWRVEHDRGRHGWGNRVAMEASAASVEYAPGLGLEPTTATAVALSVTFNRVLEVRGGITMGGTIGEQSFVPWDLESRLYLAPSLRIQPYMSAGAERTNPLDRDDVAPTVGFGLLYDAFDWLALTIGARHAFHRDPALGAGDAWWDHRSSGSWRIHGGFQVGIRGGRSGAVPPLPGHSRASESLGDVMTAARRWAEAARAAREPDLRERSAEVTQLLVGGSIVATNRTAAAAVLTEQHDQFAGARFHPEDVLIRGRLAYVYGYFDAEAGETDRQGVPITLVLERSGQRWLVRQISMGAVE